MQLQHNRILSLSSCLGDDGVVVTAFDGTEQISDIYRYQMTLLSLRRICIASVIGEAFTLKFQREGTTRWFHGVISDCQQLSASTDGTTQYRLAMLPPMGLLEHSIHNRIFENMSSVDIVASILKTTGQVIDTSKLRAYPKREICTQFGETDLAFINRLLAEDAIAYFFRQQVNSSVCVFVDAPEGFDEPFSTAVEFTGGAYATCEYRDVITEWKPYAHFTASQLNSVDYSEYASSPLCIDAAGQSVTNKIHAGCVQHYGQHYFQRSGDTTHALKQDTCSVQSARWLSAVQQAAEGVSGSATVAAFAAGVRVCVSNTGNDDSEHCLLTHVNHEIRDGNEQMSYYSNTFVAVCANKGFTPAVRGAQPVLHGVHSAKVLEVKNPVSKGAHAEVKVAFSWHMTQASCWARVAQLSAGNRWGSYFVPEPGQEVLVEFLNGNPDRPVVVGALYNINHASPPFSATQSGIRTRSRNFNELRFDDCDGKEEMYFQAGRDHNYLVGNDQSGVITNHRRTTILQGDDSTSVSAGSMIIDVAKDITIRSSRKITLQVGSSTLTIDSTGVVVKGTLVTLEANAQIDVLGGAVANISGGVVKIN